MKIWADFDDNHGEFSATEHVSSFRGMKTGGDDSFPGPSQLLRVSLVLVQTRSDSMGSFWKVSRLRGVILEGEEIEGGSYWAGEEIEGGHTVQSRD